MASSQFPVAIIGMATRLPGAQTCEEFWNLLKHGGDTVGKFPQERIPDVEHAIAPFRGQLVNKEEPFFTGSFFRSVDKFDAKFFQINPKEALFIEPEQRIFLETTWEALEDAGYAATIRGSNTGVYVGNTVNKYKYILTENHPSISHGNHSPFISSRVSYTHNLQGPAMMVATGCSSSLLAVHIACQGLLSGDCDMAIAGGITLDLLPVSAKTDIWNQLGITGPNVKCRAFDACAKGIAKGEGCGIVVLKPLAKAQADGDHIYGVLQATTANQDGHSNGITAPHPGAQANMLYKAWELAGISPDRLSYFETHGTGTELGDPIEISGITKAFKMCGLTYQENDAARKIPIGSVKANIGHLADGAAGVVSLIKVLMCMHKEKIPPAINFSTPNPHINWDTSPVYVNTGLKQWRSAEDSPTRYASVSAFGLLGTNVHAVVREHEAGRVSVPVGIDVQETNEPQLLTLAANTEQSLAEFVGKLVTFFNDSGEGSHKILQDVCYTLNTSREQRRFIYRALIFATTWETMTRNLESLEQDLRWPTSESVAAKQYGYNVNFGINKSALDNVNFPGNFYNDAKRFLDGQRICWEKFYAGVNGLQRVPLVPTYVFERTRFWPKLGQSINSKLLQLEHGLTTRDHAVRDGPKDTPRSNLAADAKEAFSSEAAKLNVKQVVHAALNEVMSTNYDWQKTAHENLFALGMDSLLCTQLSMKLHDTVNCSVTLADFHYNPTCSGLVNLVEGQVHGAQVETHDAKTKQRAQKDSPVSQDEVKLLLAGALNASLGTDYDWQKQEDDNLFSLGLDSLTLTQVNMILANALHIEYPVKMSELRNSPSYSSLWGAICDKLSTKTTTDEVVRHGVPPKRQRYFDGKESFPLSFSQKRLWVMEEMSVTSCAYNATNCLRITGKFHPGAFILAVNTLLSRHAAFFTTISDTAEGPKQSHDWQLNVKVEEIEVSESPSEAEQTTMDLYRDDYKKRFDLRVGPPVRCKLYRLPSDVFYFTMVVHHIVFDGWSHFVFYNELWDIYAKLCKGKAVEDTLHHPLNAEFAQEEQQGSTVSKMESHVAYWKEKLTGPLPLTTFPGDKRRPAVFTHNGKRITRFLGSDILDDVRAFDSEKYTVFVKLLSVVYALLHQYTGDKDLIIGTPVAARNDLKFKHVIGCFVNTLALRVSLPDSCTFQDILSEVSTVFLEAFDHQLAPFDHIVNLLNLPRDTSITPVFSVNVCYHNTEIRSEHMSPPSEIIVQRRLLHNGTTKWDMQFDFLQEPEGMRFTLEYYSDLFSDQYAELIVDNFIWLLSSCCRYKTTALTKLVPGSMGETDTKKYLSEISILRGPVRQCEKSLPELLMQSFQEHAEATAVIQTSGQRITYKQLLENSIECSMFLRDICRLQKQSRIGLLLDNSAETIQYILSSVFSGFVYVPMDPSSPRPRLEHVCNESEVRAIIFGSSYVGMANHLHWACPTVISLVCADSEEFLEIPDVHESSPLMDVELWNCVAKKAKNDIESGGWKSSYTGEHMSNQEMDEYAENVLIKLKDHIKPTTRVLEIGCASGLTVQKLCPMVAHYVATDLSNTMTARLEDELRKKGVTNVEVLCASADQVGRNLRGRKFDLIVMNSVIHCFPGHNYLRAVFRDCEQLLDKDGVIFLGDVMDLDLKERLVMTLKSFKKAHPEFRVKTDCRNELFLSRGFMQHLCDSSPVLTSVKTSRKYYTVANELTEFRYDALFTSSGEATKSCNEVVRKEVFALKDVANMNKAIESRVLHQLVSDWSRDVQPDDEAYVLYTSGTTGTPKGVIIGHEALVNYVTWATKAYQFDPSTLTPFFAPLTFDFTITSIFPPLLGGSVIRVFEPFRDSYQALAKSRDITTAKYSPLQLDTILATATQALSASIFVLGGEELTPSLLRKLKTNKGDSPFVVWNEYGPTEATVGCVVRCLTSDEIPTKESEHIPIGKPIDNVVVAVVRNQRDPVPKGGKGHLAIGGNCLCSDFAGSGTARDAKRNKSFAASCWGRPGEQMLLTEDIVELVPSTGELLYFGRDRDSETTKVNGIRLDLVEIQRTIEADPAVASAWVGTFIHESHTFLGAAVKLEHAKQETRCGEMTWKQHLVSSLAQMLPVRSIPKVFVQLSSAPTNKNGKKDLAYLQKIFLAEMNAGKESTRDVTTSDNSPQTFAQDINSTAELQRIWQSILPIDHLPRPSEDFFFDLSGDSLQAIHLVRKMRDEGYPVTVTDIFQNPSIERLAPVLQKREGENKKKRTIECEKEDEPFRPTPIVEKLFERQPPLKQPDRFSLSAVLNFHSEILPEILAKALRSVIKKHGSLRSRFGVSDGRVFQQVVPMNQNELKVEVLEIEKSVDHLANEPLFIELCDRLEQGHSLTSGHLVNAAVVNVTEEDKQEHFVLLVVHHVAVDIVSWQQLLEDLGSALKRLGEKDAEEPELSKCQVSFQTYCKALQVETERVFIHEVDYWKAVEKEYMESGRLVQEDKQSNFRSAKWVSDAIDATVIRSTSNKLECSEENILLTAFGRAIAEVHGKDKTSICLESHGRQLTTVDSTDTVGWCTSAFPVILDTPPSGDPASQVRDLERKMKKIPNHGLGFGLLKSKRELTMPIPKIMFVYQGSMDASTKETFDGGRYSFDHIPWIELMLNELIKGRFHCHPEEFLEYDLEIIAWIHGGELKFGCLFDACVVSEEVIRGLIKTAQMNILAMAKKARHKPKKITLEIIPGFNITPACLKSMTDALSHHATVATEVRVQPPEQMLQVLCTPNTTGSQSTADVTVLVPRPQTTTQADELVAACSQSDCRVKTSKSVVIVNTEDLPNTSKLEMKLFADQGSLEVDLEDLSRFYDRRSDREYNMPLTRAGYSHLGAAIARGVRACVWGSTYKVIAVDADYTLWDGECAQGAVRFNQGNIVLQEFLQKKKAEGMLLILLSKNSLQDVESVFESQKNKMKLEKDDFTMIVANWEPKSRNIRQAATMLNLGMDSFVFMDDNPVECEEMIHRCPDVLTLQFPSQEELVAPLLGNLWVLDRAETSDEAERRTEMYRSELARQTELKGVQSNAKEGKTSLNQLLLSWKMELVFCKTTVNSLKDVRRLYTRAAELLQRTNQFKMNDQNINLAHANNDDTVWLVSLVDKHGSYGIVSVLVLNKTSDGVLVKQWVLSCRALGRRVEEKILEEIHKEAKKLESESYVNLAVSKTTRNIPALKFLKDTGIDMPSTNAQELTVVRSESSYLNTPSEILHNTKLVSNLDLFLGESFGAPDATKYDPDSQPKQTTTKDKFDIQRESRQSSGQSSSPNQQPFQKNPCASLTKLHEWINENWSPTQKQQALFLATFPFTAAPRTPAEMHTRKGSIEDVSGRETALRSSWMEVLNTRREPEDSDNFVQCGGNSFGAVHLVSMLRRLCHIEISIVDVLQCQTYAELKHIVAQARSQGKDETSVEISGPLEQLGLTKAQQRMVLMQQTTPNSAAYVETVAYRVSERKDPTEIISELVEKHPILRSRIRLNDETLEYSMTVEKKIDIEVTLETVDSPKVSEVDLKKTTPVIPVIDSNLFRARYVTAEDDAVLVLHVHHVIVDDVTLAIIASDLEELLQGTSITPASNSSLDYVNYVEQERTYSKSKKCEEDEEFWKRNFESLPPESNLAICPKAESTSFETRIFAAKHSIRLLSDKIIEGISAYCQASGLTEFQYFLSCAVLVLQRYLGVQEVTMAIPVTTRTENHHRTDGLFVNTVLCRITVDHRLTVKEHIEAVARQWLEVFRYSSYPLDQVTKTLWTTHGKNSSSFCSVMFNYATRNLKKKELTVRTRDAKMPLSLDVVHERQSGVNEARTSIVAEWADQLIDDGMVERLVDSVEQLCSKAFINDSKRLLEVQVLSSQEHGLLRTFSSTTESKTEGSLPVHTSFQNYVQTSPDSTAIAIHDRRISYRTLDELSSKIASALCLRIKEDVLKNSPVVILANKDEYAIAAIFGVWKAGGHFLPVAVTNRASLKNILARNQPAAILTNLPVETIRLEEQNIQKCPLFGIEDLTMSLSRDYNTRCPNTSSDDLAYIILTSGSTGTPKQCKISHRSLRIIANAWRERYSMTEFNVNVMQWAPLSFDVFVGDVVRALICAPGQLTICPDERRLDVSYILQLISKHHVTMTEVTPLFGQQLVENASQDQLTSMRIFILGSDVLQRHIYHTIREKLRRNQRVLNSYGMTEATIDSAFFEGDTVPVTRSDTVPIGKPLPGVGLHVLDPETFLPCPVGTVGELFISGDVLASGDVDLIPASYLGSRALKTGDAACWLPSGDIELMGRTDNMVKMRGFRISTAEIENKIVQTTDLVTQACVVPLCGQRNTEIEFLCAFLVIDRNADETTIVDRNYICGRLKDELPYYMLPDIVHIIREIPLSSNGKVDRRALPEVAELLESIVAPALPAGLESPTTTMLKALFAEALGLPDAEQVDQERTFMEQGGHSLILVKFSTLIKQRTSFNVTIADIFSYPTIKALEEYIAQEAQDYQNENQDQQLLNAMTIVPSNREIVQDIAITGIGLRLPRDIMTLPQLWEVLEHGHHVIGEFSEKRTQDVLGCVSQENARILSEAETFQGAFFERIDEFDSKFFKIPPGEAKFMSPEQRMFLQVATEALAESKPLSEVSGSKIGVFVGSSEIGYSRLHHPDEATCISGLLPGMIANRVAYQWDLKGPTMLVDTTCSSSLMALKQACEAIARGECEGALAGGVSLLLYPARSGVFGKTSILSEDFKCRAFDKDATGTAVGEGVMCLYVEPLDTAVAERKAIYGVVKGIASNGVGHGNGITAPSASSQRDVIRNALNSAGVQPSEVSFVEAHGTGTKLGDRIELSALRSVFGDTRDSELPVGSVKSIFGHLDAAAGLMGVFKTLASLSARKIPPTAHFTTPHPELLNSGLSVPHKTIDWQPSKTAGARIAGVSSFGLTGTNLHAIIAEIATTDDQQAITGGYSYPLLIASSDLDQLKRQLRLHKIYISQSILKSGTNSLGGMCLTVAKRLKELTKVKSNMEWRLVVTAKDPRQMLKAVEIAEGVSDQRAVVQLARLRSDINFRCPQYTDVKSAVPAIGSYLRYGTVNVDELFHGECDTIRLSPGVTLAIYDEKRHWLDPCEKIQPSSERLELGELLGIKVNETRELVRSLPLAPPADLEETQGTFCSAIIIKLFQSSALSDHLTNPREITFKEAFSLAEMMPKYDKFFFVMVRELWRNDMLEATGTDESIHRLDSFVFQCEHLLDTDPSVIANQAIQKYPSWADCFRFPLYCSQHLERVVRGQMSPLSVIYPRGDLNFMFQFDKLGDLLGDVYYNMYMQLIASYAKQLSERGRPVRILEVGAGVGHVTRQIVPKLKDTPNIEYWFTDLGKAFVEHARTTFSDYLHMMKFATFDITKSAPKQGLLGSFDIIVSYNVIHTTQSIMESVLNLKSCLGGEGTLFIIESAKNETWATLAWGMLDGWWYFKDYELRPAEPMMEAEKWERVLQGVGFESVITCPNQDDERVHVEKFMFLCSQKPGSDSTRSKEILSQLGWWETDTHRFDPVKKLEELEDDNDSEDDDAQNAGKQGAETQGERKVYEELKKIWSELLGEDDIHAEDDFNSLGGESLLAIQMMNLVKKRIGFQLEIADTFGYPTLGALAGFIMEELEKDTNAQLIVGKSSRSQQTEDQNKQSKKADASLKPNIQLVNLSTSELTTKDKGTLLMFPGQGSQKVGMCLTIKDSNEAKKIFSLAEEELGYNVLEICMGDETILQQKLKSTEFVQVALFVGCLAKIEQLKVERPDVLAKVSHVAGLSVGEFAALVYAGVLDFKDALHIVQMRGKAMEEIVRQTPTGMVSVFGPTCEQLESYLNKHYPCMKISTYLADNQHTVAGKDLECGALVESLSREHQSGMDIIDVRKLRVAGAFHSPYMSEASDEINELIMPTPCSKPSMPIIMNVNGRLVNDPSEIKELICRQLTAAVKWKQTVVTAYGLGVQSFVEIAPGRVLSSIVKKRIKECQRCDVEYIQV